MTTNTVEQADLGRLRQFLSVAAFFERKIKDRDYASDNSFFSELIYVSNLYKQLTQQEQEKARHVIEQTNRFRDDVNCKAKNLATFVQLNLFAYNQDKVFSYPYRGGAIYRLLIENGKSVASSCIYGGDFLKDEKFQSGNLPLPMFSSALDLKVGIDENMFIEADLVFNLKPENKEFFYQLSTTAKLINEDNQLIIDGLHWLNVLAIIVLGHDPDQKLTVEQKAKLTSLVFWYQIRTEDLLTFRVYSYGTVSVEGLDSGTSYIIDHTEDQRANANMQAYQQVPDLSRSFSVSELSELSAEELQQLNPEPGVVGLFFARENLQSFGVNFQAVELF